MENSKTYDFLEVLEREGSLSRTARLHVEALTTKTDEPLDQIIYKLGLIDENEYFNQISRFTGLSQVSISPLTFQPPDKVSLNTHYLTTRRLLIYRDDSDSEQNKLAMVDPFDEDALSAMRFALGTEVEPLIISNTQFEKLFPLLYVEDEGESGPETDISSDTARLEDLASAEPVVRLVNRLVSTASEQRASDIHVEASLRDTQIRFRIDGVLHARETMSRKQGLAVLSRIKILAGLDIAERRRPQDGRFSFPVAGRNIDLRVSTVPTDHGESAVLRLLDKSQVTMSYDTLGFDGDTVDQIKRILTKPHGILLVTGPTGSGKTTTLYTFLQDLATGDKKILTVEDPIEYRLAGISQSQVNAKIDVTFASALRSFLRHDPDVMMVGEIRDLETARIAIQAALTGHLVLSTLHTNDAVSAITRLRDLGVEDYLIASTLNGVIGQRLLRKLCPECTGIGCDDCSTTGYDGRLAVTEVLEINQDVSSAIRDGHNERSILKATPAFRSMAADADLKISSELTSTDERQRVLGGVHG